MEYLEELRIGSNSFQNVEIVEIRNLMSLRKVVFGSYSFNNRPELTIPYLREQTGIEIVNCPNLRTIEFESYSFGDYYRLYMSGMIK